MGEINWNSRFVASMPEKIEGATKLILKGVLLDQSANRNGWMIEKEDFEQVAKDFLGHQIRADHSEKISDVLGKIVNTELDGPHKETKEAWDPPTESEHIHFFAEITTNNDNILIPIKLGYIDHVSPAVDSKTLLCSVCRRPMLDRFMKSCKCDGSVILLKDISPRETSLVSSPAYDGTVFIPSGFAAAVNKSFLSKEEILKIVDEELKKRGLYE